MANKPVTLSGHQPEFWPWLGYFHKIFIADKFAIVDHINFQKKNYQDRIMIRTNHGKDYFKWIHIALQKEGDVRFIPINKIKINNERKWKEEQLTLLKNSYGKAPHFDEVFRFIKEIYDKDYSALSDLNIEIIRSLCNKLNIKTPLLVTSENKIIGNKTELLVNMCKKFQCNGYISGEGARAYFEPAKFQENKLIHKFRISPKFEYNSFWKPLVPGMSILDCLFSIGFKETEKIIKEVKYEMQD